METSIIVAIIGACVALLGVLITASIGFLTWSRNIKYQILKQYSDSLTNNSINAKLVALIMYEFPKNVNNEFEKARKLGAFSNDDERSNV